VAGQRRARHQQRQPGGRPKPNIRVTSRKVDRYAAGVSAGSMGKRAFMSRRKIPYGLTCP
jgi:hypothetical protein